MKPAPGLFMKYYFATWPKALLYFRQGLLPGKIRQNRNSPHGQYGKTFII
jgi:hypothetical protein